MKHIATTFDHKYFKRALLMKKSLAKHLTDRHIIHALCWDDLAYRDAAAEGFAPERVESFLPSVPWLYNLHLHSLAQRVCITRWFWFAELVRQHGTILHVDADILFFAPADELWGMGPGAPAVLVPHNLPTAAEKKPGVTFEQHWKFGKYNGGMALLRAPEAPWHVGLCSCVCCMPACTENLRGQTGFGDQRYLEDIEGAASFPPHVSVGPWSIHKHQMKMKLGPFGDPSSIMYAGQRLISYHYSAVRGQNWVAYPEYEITEQQRKILYDPYLRALGL